MFSMIEQFKQLPFRLIQMMMLLLWLNEWIIINVFRLDSLEKMSWGRDVREFEFRYCEWECEWDKEDGMERSQWCEVIKHTRREGGKSVVVEVMKGMRVWWWMKWNEDGKVFEVDIVVEDVWRKGDELIGIEVYEWREESLLEYNAQMEYGWRNVACVINGRNRKVRLLSPLKTPECREVSELE